MFKKFLEKKGLTSETFKDLEASKQAEHYNEFVNELATKGATKEEVAVIKGLVEKAATKEELAAITKSINDLSIALDKSQKNQKFDSAKTIKEAVKNALVDKFKKNGLINEDGEFKKGISKDDLKGLNFNIINKADLAINIAATGASVPNFPSDDANVDANYLYETATELGVVSPLRRSTSVLNAIMATMPTPIMIGQALKRTIITDGSGAPIKVTELAKKPNMTIDISKEKSESEKLAAAAVISEEALNRIDMIVNEILKAMTEVSGEVLEDEFFAQIDAYGVPYSHNAALEVETPTYLDAIFAVATSMKMAKFSPTHVMLSSVDIFNMFGSKGTDGHYNLANGQSIQLLNNGTQLAFANMTLTIIEVEDVTVLAAGNFKVLDLGKIDFGLSPNFIIRYSEHLFFLQNAHVWLVEKAFASLLPSVYSSYAVVEDTFEDVIDDITKVVA